MKTFTQLKKNLKKLNSEKQIKVAILGDTSTQLLSQAIIGMGIDYDIHLNLWEADYNLIDNQIFNPESELYKFEPEIIILFNATHSLLKKYSKLSPIKQIEFAETRLEIINTYFETITQNLNAKIIYFNYPEINDSVYGSFANKIESSFLFQLRKLNFHLMEMAIKTQNLFICDITGVQNNLGKKNMFSPSIYINTDMVISLDVLPYVASRTIQIIAAIRGKIKKCLILDLDNTLWGGVIGDDGLENIQLGSLGIGKAFTELQLWIKKLKNRGIILTVCSKNTESVAKEPFEKHPDMILKLDDIAVFMANWDNKAENINKIQEVLNIGFDSMVFLDDNPFERNLVRENIPDITVPELPEDPAEYLEFLYELNLFETISYSKEDSDRTKKYQIEAKRVELKKSFVNEKDYLRSLNMHAKIEAFNKFNTPRIAQLTQRSNQFNLRTIRYTEADIKRISNNNKYYPFAFNLEDKFGDHGLICVIILESSENRTLFIDTWIMSCRVLKRSVESFVLNVLVKFALNNGFKQLKGEFIQTQKNNLVKDHYKRLGFYNKLKYWYLDTNNFNELECQIKTFENEFTD